MRPVFLGNAPHEGGIEDKVRWIMRALTEIEQASRAEGLTISDGYTLTDPVTALRTFDPATATAQNVADVLGTLLMDMKNRGEKRT